MLDIAREEITRNTSIFDEKSGQRPARKAAQKCEVLMQYYFPFLLSNELSPTEILAKWNNEWSELDKKALAGEIKTPQHLVDERKRLLREAETTSNKFQEQFLKMDLYQKKKAWGQEQKKLPQSR